MSMPENPTPSPDRHALPIAWDIPVASDERFALLVDATHLHDCGLLADPYRDASTEELSHLLDSLGQRGCYESHVRATGPIYTCPSWCDSLDHPRVGIAEPPGAWTCGPIHAGAETNVQLSGTTLTMHLMALDARCCTDTDATAPAICLNVKGSELTAADARVLAAALLNAADLLDEVTA